DLALVVAADTIGDDIEPACVVAKQRILVDLASAADVGTRHGMQLHRTQFYHSWRCQDRLATMRRRDRSHHNRVSCGHSRAIERDPRELDRALRALGAPLP